MIVSAQCDTEKRLQNVPYFIVQIYDYYVYSDPVLTFLYLFHFIAAGGGGCRCAELTEDDDTRDDTDSGK